MPVQLDSNKVYTLFCNSLKFRNFKNINGIPLNPDFLIFQTKGDYKPDFSQKTYNEFIEIFPKRYSYASKNQLNWPAIIEQNRLADSKTNTEFALKLINVLKNAEDPHLVIEFKGQKYPTCLRKFYVANYNINEIFKKLKEAKISEGKNVISGKYGDIGYICIGTWENSRKDDIRTAIDRLHEFESLQNIIIDVRTNAGGDEELAKEFASCFIEKPVPYGLVKNYNQQTGKFDAEYIKTVEPDKNGFIYKGNVYVLTGPGGLSSNESFVLMMKQVKNAKIVGMRTYGSSGNPKPYELSDDITLYLPSWQACTLDNELIEGNGIEPDIEIINSQSDFIGKDALFDEVIDIIKMNQ